MSPSLSLFSIPFLFENWKIHADMFRRMVKMPAPLVSNKIWCVCPCIYNMYFRG